MQYIASLSYGKDSMAMLHVIKDVLDLPLDRIITADVWATDTIPADLPPMVEFKDYADKEIKRRWGIEVEHFCAMEKDGEKTTYDKCLHKPITKQADGFENRIGLNRGFPYRKGAWCQRDLKVNALNEMRKRTFESRFYKIKEHSRTGRDGDIYGWPFRNGAWCNSDLKMEALKKMHKYSHETIQYIGIAADEPNRFHNASESKLLPLVEAGWTEQMCRDWCGENDLLSPIYTDSARGGCWFCHNQGVEQLRLLRKNYPEYWQLLLKWDKDSPVSFHADGKSVHDFEKRFRWEDDGYMPTETRFRWADVDNPQMNIFQFVGDDENED